MERAVSQVWLLEIREYWARLEAERPQAGATGRARDTTTEPEPQATEPPPRAAILPAPWGGSCALVTCPDEGDRPAAGD